MVFRGVLSAFLLMVCLTSQASEPQQLRLTDALVGSFVKAQVGLAEVGRDIEASEPPSPAIAARLEHVARTNGFTGFEQLDNTAYSIALVLAGMNQRTGVYVSRREVLQRELLSVERDPSLSREDREELLAELRERLQGVEEPLNVNIAVVRRNLVAILRALN